jgi:hypothetical protein
VAPFCLVTCRASGRQGKQQPTSEMGSRPGREPRESCVRTKDYWKGKPKLQGWYKTRRDAEAVKESFERAKGAGRTFARAPGGWVTEWVVQAADAASRGHFPAPGPEDDEYRSSLALVREQYAMDDVEELKRRLVVLTGRALRNGRDPFGLKLHLANVAEA